MITRSWNKSMPKQSFDVLAVGNGCLDIILTGLDGNLNQKPVLYGTQQLVIPGGGFTTPVVLQRLGAKVTWAADFGNDTISQFIMKAASDEGVDLSFSRIKKHEIKRLSVSMSDEVNRSFLSFEDPDPLIPAAFSGMLRVRAKAAYMPGTRLDWMFLVGAFIARMRKMTIIVDGNGSEKYHIEQKMVKRCLKLVDIYLLNTDEASGLTGKTMPEDALRQLSQYSKLVVLKDGANGAMFINGDRCEKIPALPVSAVDTTGAGDSFNAGFIAAWLKRLPLRECVEWANITAGLSTTIPGGATMKIHLEDILSNVKNYPLAHDGIKS